MYIITWKSKNSQKFCINSFCTNVYYNIKFLIYEICQRKFLSSYHLILSKQFRKNQKKFNEKQQKSVQRIYSSIITISRLFQFVHTRMFFHCNHITTTLIDYSLACGFPFFLASPVWEGYKCRNKVNIKHQK